MKSEKKSGVNRAWLCRAGIPANQPARLAQAGYPRFLFRLAAARRIWGEVAAGGRRHD